MPVNPETQAPTRASRQTAKRKAKRNQQQAVSTIATATASGTTHPHRTSDVLPAEVQAAQEHTTTKKVKKARRAARAYARARKGIERQQASGGTPQQELDRRLHPEPKSLDIFIDPKTHRPDHFSAHAPAIDQVYRALTGTDPYASSAHNALKIGEFLAETAAGGAAGKVIGDAAKARAALKVSRAETVAKGALDARKAVTTEKVAEASTKTGKAARKAEGAVKARYAKEARKLRRATRVESHAHSINPATGALASTKQGRALIGGTVTADPKKSLETTARAIPASLAFGATALYDIGKAAATQDTDPLKGLAKEAKASVEALKPLISGDPDKVRKATEESIGYVGAPLLPKAGGAVAKATRPLTESVLEHVPERARLVKASRTRKRVSVLASRETQAARSVATRVANEIEKPLRKGPKARRKVRDIIKGRDTLEAGDTVAVLARYGINRHDPIKQIERVEKSLRPKDAPAETTTLKHVAQFLRENPEVAHSDHVWQAVDAYKARVNETSPTAKFRGQGDVFDITPPEDRVPLAAREHTPATTRGEAWADWKAKVSEARAARRKGDQLRAQAREATGARRDQLLMQAEASRRDFQRLTAEAKDFHRTLDPYSRPGQSLEGKRTRWTKDLVDEYVADVQKAAKEAGFDDPAWVSERGPKTVDPANVGATGAKPGPRARHVKTGESARTDIADRSLRTLIADSVWHPRMQQALDRFIRRTVEEFSIPQEINGHRVTEITGREWNDLVAAKQINPREVVALPSRDYKQAVLSEDFDLDRLHTDFNQRLRGEIKVNAERDGSKYVVMPKEAAKELADQINPSGGGLESGLSLAGTAGSRVILFSPAWVTSQVVAEGLQAGAAVGPLAWTRAARTLHKLKREDPEGYEAFSTMAGASPASLEQPHALRVSMTGDTQAQFRAAGRALRRTATGRALYNTATLRVFGLLDRWKSGKYRTVIAAAKADREFNGFVRGLQGMLREQDAIAKKLAPMSRREQLSYVARHPDLFDKHLDYVDDVAGNWQAFTRYERKLAPLVMFYPYLRMSLRWTFWSYPKNHPVRAQIMYLLAQQNSNEIDKLLGDGNAKFIDYAMPIVHNDQGVPDQVLPGGQRFGAPGLNTLVQAVGEDNYAGLLRVLNPVLSIPVYAATGLDPLSGEQTLDTGDARGRALLALNQLLSLSPEARFAGINDVGAKPKSAASKVFSEFDPNRSLRSFAVPFLPQSAENARKEAELSHQFDVSGEGAKTPGEFIQQAESIGLDQAIARLKDKQKADDFIKHALSGAESPAEEKRIKKIIAAYYSIKYGTGSSSGLSGGGLSGGGLSGGGLSGGGLGN